jgi:hypothetical protein
VYKPGKENIVADALSRIAHLYALQAVAVVQPQWIQEVLNSYATDPKAQQLLTELALVNPNAKGFSLHQGLIRKQNLIWIAQNLALQTKLIATFHSSAIGGHSGVLATYNRLTRHFYWKGMKKDVDSYVQQCSVCQQAKHNHSHPAGLLQPLPIPDGVWQDLSMDFIEGLPKSEGYSVILVVVDRLTKFAHFLPVKHPYTAVSIAKVFLDNIVKMHGLPKIIVTDRDTILLVISGRSSSSCTGLISISLLSTIPRLMDKQSGSINALRCF